MPEWSATLDRVLQAVRAIRAGTQWEGIENLEDALQAYESVQSLPPP